MEPSRRRFEHPRRRRSRYAIVVLAALGAAGIVAYLTGRAEAFDVVMFELTCVALPVALFWRLYRASNQPTVEIVDDRATINSELMTYSAWPPPPETFRRRDVSGFRTERGWWPWGDDYVIELRREGSNAEVNIPSSDLLAEDREEFCELFDRWADEDVTA